MDYAALFKFFMNLLFPSATSSLPNARSENDCVRGRYRRIRNDHVKKLLTVSVEGYSNISTRLLIFILCLLDYYGIALIANA